MRLPYLQVTDETWTKARMLAALLGVGRHEALGLAVELWAWAVELGRKDEPPTGRCDGPLARTLLAAAVEWKGDAGRLVDAFETVGLLEQDDKGLRVKGLDRYRSAWEKASRSRDFNADRARKAAQSRWSATPEQCSNDAQPMLKQCSNDAQPMLKQCSNDAQPMLKQCSKHGSSNAQAMLKHQKSMLGDAKTETETETYIKTTTAPSAPGVLGDLIAAAFKAQRGASFAWRHRDEMALGEVLRLAEGDETEVVRRWRIGLRAKFPACSGIVDLARHWNAFASEEPRRPAAAPEPSPRSMLPKVEFDVDEWGRPKKKPQEGLSLPAGATEEAGAA